MNNTLIKGLALLETLARSSRPMSLTELAVELKFAKSNVHRLLQALIALQYVSRDEARGAYRPSIRLWGLGSSVLANFDLRQVAEPVMQKVLDSTLETVHLSILDGEEIVYILRLESPRPVRAPSRIGDRAVAHCVATGKAILAYQSEEFLQSLSLRLRAYTPRTITDPAAFLRDMKAVRTRGYSVNRGGWRDGVNSVGAPVWDRARVVAAIGISGPAERVRSNMTSRIGALLVDAAGEISQRLAGGGKRDPLHELMKRMRRGRS